jgi:hypothetical protein
MVIAEQLFYISLFSRVQTTSSRWYSVQCRALNFWCVRARADFSLSIIRIVTFVQVKLLLLFANIYTPSLSLEISNKHTIQLFFLVRNKTKQSIHLEPAAAAYMYIKCMRAVDLMELILILRSDWKEVNQLISHNNIACAHLYYKRAHTHNIQKVTGAYSIHSWNALHAFLWRGVCC